MLLVIWAKKAEIQFFVRPSPASLLLAYPHFQRLQMLIVWFQDPNCNPFNTSNNVNHLFRILRVFLIFSFFVCIQNKQLMQLIQMSHNFLRSIFHVGSHETTR